MRIGVPREIKNHEYRVGMTPSSVRELQLHGHQVQVQKGAGAAIGLTDEQYRLAGATLVDTAQEVFAWAEMIVKVKEPQPAECAMLRPGQILYTYLHLAPDPAQTAALVKSGAVCVAYETITGPGGGLPLLAPMSEVAGRMSIQAGAAHLEKSKGGMGLLLGGVPGVPPAHVLILGAGVVGTNALQMAVGLGARVSVFDRNVDRLRQLDLVFGNRIETVYSTAQAIEEHALQADLQLVTAEVCVDQAQHAGEVQRFQPEQRLVPPQVAGEAVAFGPYRLVLAQPGRAVLVAALHLHHMGHGVHGPGHARVGFQRAAAGVLGLRIEVALLQSEGVQRQHVAVQRVGGIPVGQRTRGAQPQAGGVAAIEVPQLRPLQRQRVARVLQQQRVPGPAGGVPAAFEHQLHGFQVRAFARRGVLGQGAGVREVGVGLTQQRGFGQAEQEPSLHDMRQGPARVGGHSYVQVGQRRVVERHHAPQRQLGCCARLGAGAAAGVAARVGVLHRAECSALAPDGPPRPVQGGVGQGRSGGRNCSQARARRSTPRSS